MVSNVKYYCFKTINLKKSVPFLAIFAIVIFLALLSYQPAIVLFAGFVVYALSGYVGSAYMWLSGVGRRSRRRPSASAAPPPATETRPRNRAWRLGRPARRPEPGAPGPLRRREIAVIVPP